MLKESHSCVTCENKNCFLKTLSPEWLLKMDVQKGIVRYPKGQYIFKEGESVNGIYFIYLGKVKVIVTGWQEKEQIVRLAADGHILGHRGYGRETYPISAIALDDSMICFVDNDTIFEAFMSNLKLTYNMMMFYSQELRGVEKRMMYMAQMTVREKVAYALFYLKEVFGFNTTENIVNVTITRADIATLAGISKEQVVRTLTDFEKEKMLAKVKRKIRILNEKRIQEIIERYR